MKTLKYLIAPSVLNADFTRLGSEITAVQKGGAGLLHLDIMDGNFVPNISFGPAVSASIHKATTLPLDCHLMIDHPEQFVEQFAKAGAERITIQVESTRHLDRVLQQIREAGVKPCVTLNPATPLESILPVLDLVEMVLIMSVNPGFGGQSLIPYCLDKVAKIRSLKPQLDIQIDGGIKKENILEAKAAGANIFVVGSAIYSTANPEQTCREFVEIINS
jgi:ribulose-phosphate 3-epimerase